MKLYEIVSVIIVASLGLWAAYGFLFENNIEHANYKVIKKFKSFELRKYENLKTISTNYTNSNQAFRQLFKMIDGNNKSNQKIAMTAPVIQDKENMMFVMPNKLDIIPEPNSQKVTIKIFKDLSVAVKTFNGSARNTTEQLNNLKNDLNKQNITYSEKWYLCQYNSPWVMSIFRKNEIWIEIE